MELAAPSFKRVLRDGMRLFVRTRVRVCAFLLCFSRTQMHVGVLADVSQHSWSLTATDRLSFCLQFLG